MLLREEKIRRIIESSSTVEASKLLTMMLELLYDMIGVLVHESKDRKHCYRILREYLEGCTADTNDIEGIIENISRRVNDFEKPKYIM